MMSDNEYDGFDYHSSQDSFYFDELIDRFELSQSFKLKSTKQRSRKRTYPISFKTLKGNTELLKVHCANDQVTANDKQKSFRYQCQRQKPKRFECNRLLKEPVKKSTNESTSTTIHQSKKYEYKHLQDFSEFRRHFYHVMHKTVKSLFKHQSYIKISNIRLASVHESVQKTFMQSLKQNSQYFPQLVYHGTHRNNIQSILRYGFLIPDRRHPNNPEAPIIECRHGDLYGNGIYSCFNASYTLSYVEKTNTLLACAALIPYKRIRGAAHRHGDILISTNESHIIPLFLIDYTYSSLTKINFLPYYPLEIVIEDRKQQVKRPVITVEKSYLRKILNYINDRTRRNNCYQKRLFEF
ncbi:unnamed protein product [Rotaria sp. Silwood1]|nr:unnamed protein product [Rotaria sp. Silwood1]